MIDARQKGENAEHQKEVNAERQTREVEEVEIIIVAEEERGNNHLFKNNHIKGHCAWHDAPSL